MRVYHYLPSKWALDNIRHRRLKVSRIKNLNDPFDFNIHIDTPGREDYRGIRDVYHERFGLICFSEEYSDPVQWAHYADRHGGVALGFDVCDDLLSEVTYVESPWTVILSDGGGTEDEWREVSFAMTCKYENWSYEREHRIIMSLSESEAHENENGDLIHYRYFDNRIELKEVILGINHPGNANLYIDAIGQLSGVKVFWAGISPDEYKVCKAHFLVKT